MKISEIKSDEVREEALRLAIGENGWCLTQDDAIKCSLWMAFDWELSLQKNAFWYHLCHNHSANTPDLKLPKQEL
jgi:hypothetical protein